MKKIIFRYTVVHWRECVSAKVARLLKIMEVCDQNVDRVFSLERDSEAILLTTDLL